MPGLYNAATPMVDPWAAMMAGAQPPPVQPPALQGLSPDMMAQIIGMTGKPGVMNPAAPAGMTFGGPDPRVNAELMNMGVNPNSGQSIPGLSAATSGAPPVDPQRMQQLAGQLAQQMPPPEPGSLSKMMQDPRMAAMMQGLKPNDRRSELEKIALSRHYVAPPSLGAGSGMKVEVPGVMAQAQAQRRGSVPGLGAMLLGRK